MVLGRSLVAAPAGGSHVRPNTLQRRESDFLSVQYAAARQATYTAITKRQSRNGNKNANAYIRRGAACATGCALVEALVRERIAAGAHLAPESAVHSAPRRAGTRRRRECCGPLRDGGHRFEEHVDDLGLVL